MKGDTSTITPEDVLAHSAWLQRLALRLVDGASSEDLVQDTWTRAVRAKPDRGRPLRPWLGQVLRNLARMRARSSSRWAARAGQVAASEDVPLPSPEELLTYHETQRLVAEAVTELAEPYRSTVLLCYAQGLEPAEVAARQGIPGGTVRWRLKRGLDDLRAKLDARYGGRRAWCMALGPLAAQAAAAQAPAGGAVLLASRTAAWKVAAAMVGAGAVGLALFAATVNRPAAPAAPLAQNESRTQEDPAAAARLLTPARLAGSARATGPSQAPGNEPPPRAFGAAAPGGAPAAPSSIASEQAEAMRRALDPAGAPMRGNPKAPVTIVVWTEFQCPFCAKAVPTMNELLAVYPNDVRLVFRHLPLPFHEAAGLASEAAMAAHEQGKFWQMHDRLFAEPGRLDPAALTEHAQAIGLDVEKFKSALETGKFRKQVDEETRIAKAAGITGTPAFFINGERMMGAQPLPAFRQKVDEALARAKGLPPPERPAAKAPATRPPPGPILPSGQNPFWPPPHVTLPDHLLGAKIAGRFVTGTAPMRGVSKAPVEVLYFTALRCDECFRARAVLDGLLATYGQHIRVVAKVVPFSDTPESWQVAQAALAAHAQGKFWQLHDRLTEARSRIDLDKIVELAKDAGLDADDLRAAVEDGRHRAALVQDAEPVRAAALGIPAFVVNGRRADGTVALVQLVETAIRAAGAKPPPWPTGTPAVDVTMFLDTLQLFAAESREEAWAGVIEKAIGPLLESDLKRLDTTLVEMSIECRTSVCRVTWRPGKGADGRMLARAVEQLYGVGPSRPGRPNEHYLVMREVALRAPEAAVARIRSRRGTQLFNLRTGRAPADHGLPLDRLPRE